MVFLKLSIALMIREKQTKQVKHCVLSVYTIGPCFVLDFVLEDTCFCKDRRCDEHLIYPMIIRIVIIRIFWWLSEIPGTPQNFLRTPRHSLKNSQNFLRISSSEFSEDLILRIFWGSSSSEFSGDRHPQNFLRILIFRIFWGSSSSGFSEDRHLQNFLKILILRIFGGSSSSDFSEDPEFSFNKCFLKWKKRLFSNKKHLSSENSEDLQKILRMTIFRKNWGWGPSENFEDSQKILRIVWGWGSSEDEDPQKILRPS